MLFLQLGSTLSHLWTRYSGYGSLPFPRETNTERKVNTRKVQRAKEFNAGLGYNKMLHSAPATEKFTDGGEPEEQSYKLQICAYSDQLVICSAGFGF